MTLATSRILGRILDLRKTEYSTKLQKQLLDALEEAVKALDDQTEQYPQSNPRDALQAIERIL